MGKRNTKSFGAIEISSSFLLLIVVIIIVIIIVFVAIKIFKKPPPPPPEIGEKKQEPVYEVVVGDVKFKLKEAKDRGNILKSSENKNPEWQREDLITTDRFVEVTISVENVGKENLAAGSWDINELIDKEERHFYYAQTMEPWIPVESKCGALLKPGFTPTSCTKIYEVANIATGLKVRVSAKTTGVTPKPEEAFIDLGF